MLEVFPYFRMPIAWKLRKPGDIIGFTDRWPDSLSHIRGKNFKIAQTAQIPYAIDFKLPGNKYLDVDISNATDKQKLYPETEDVIYELLLGFKPFNGFIQFYFPAETAVHRLDYVDMIPSISDANKRYIGAIEPKDSPADDPRLKLILPAKLDPLILRIYTNPSEEYEKVIWVMTINKCKIEKTTEAPKPADIIPYMLEVAWRAR